MGEAEEKKEDGQNKPPEKKPSGHPLLKLLLLAGVAGASYYLYTNYRLERQDGRLVVSWRENAISTASDAVQAVSVSRRMEERPYIRIATLNLDPRPGGSGSKGYPPELLATSVREFDLIAIQGIQSDNPRLLLDLVEEMNRESDEFDFAVDPDVNRGVVRQYNAFIFKRGSIETDLRNLFTVDIAGKGFRYRPLVGHFRVRGPQPADAFTFCLINAYIPMDCSADDERIPIDDARIALREMKTMVEVFETAAEAVPKEDDIIITGGLNMHPWYGSRVSGFDKWDPEVLAASVKKGLVIPDLDRLFPFSTHKSVAIGNFFLRRKMTIEYTGRADIRELPPATEEAYRTRHLAWAEFYAREGAPRVASAERYRW
jgi:hypothetical protein